MGWNASQDAGRSPRGANLTEQWFDEAQFESYRVLGLQTVRALCGGGTFDSPRDLCLAAQQGQL